MTAQRLFIVSIITLSWFTHVTSVIVRTKYGSVSGTKFTTYRGRKVDAFLGIPYAKPPVKENRFRDPQPVDKWEGVRSANTYGAKCVQYIYYQDLPQPVEGEEDCLFLNIYTPNVNSPLKLNVMVFIHGGCFMFGDGNSYTPFFILDHHDFVFVTLNYRLGPLGFLSTDDHVIPGNFGLKDQVLALKWVKDNIECFGGDSRKITLTGNSAGAVSVHLHYMSPLSRDLFMNGISESGTAFNPWAMAECPLQKAKMLSGAVGCPTNTSKDILECLQKKDVVSIYTPIKRLFLPWVYNPFSPFGPVVEPKSNNAFLTENPYSIISEGKLKDAPWMTSLTTEEGLYPAATFIANEMLMHDLDVNWNNIAPFLLDYNYTVSQERKIEVSQKIRKHYLGEGKINKENIYSLVKLISERLYSVGTEKVVRLQASVSRSPVYLFVFGYKGKYSVSNDLCRCNESFGVSHVDSTIYLLNTPFLNVNHMTEQDQMTIETMTNLWTSFAALNVPYAENNLRVPRVWSNIKQKGDLTYLFLTSSSKIKSSPNLTNIEFWDSVGLVENENVPSGSCINCDILNNVCIVTSISIPYHVLFGK